jgi:hypothetical protein
LQSLFQKSVTFEKTDEVKEAKEAKCKRKVRLLAFSQVPGLILNFSQAEKAESKAAAEVRPFFRYSQVLSYPSQKGEADASTTRKRHRSSRHVPQVGAEQEIAIPGMYQSLAPLFFAHIPACILLAILSQDVSLPIMANASVLLQSTNLSTKDTEFLQQCESYLQRQLYVCGYSLKHFFSLHEFLDRELLLVHAEFEQDTEMADDEGDDIIFSLADNFQSLTSACSSLRRKFLLLV